MKRLALSLALAAFATISIRAQDNHYGPVVYPTNTSPETESTAVTNTAPPASTVPAQSFASNATPTAPESGPVTLPPLDASPATPATPATPSTPAAPDASSTPTPTPDTSSMAPPAADASAPATSTNAPAAPDATVIAPDSAPSTSSSAPNSALAPLQSLAATPGTAQGGKPDDIYDIRPPYFYLKPLTWLWVLLGALAMASIVAALIVWLCLRSNHAMRAKSAYELALEKLEKARALLNDQNPEPYAVLVSETIRNYLGQRFHTPSTRRTTEEFLRQMQADTSTPLAEHRDLLRGFLESCDLVKFAHYQPGLEELEQVQQRAVSFVTATRPMEEATA
jgi:hypothetical protein